jgi:hypothetical protein
MRSALSTKIGVVLTLTLLLLAYYWTHKPVSFGQTAALFGLVRDIVIVSVMTLAAGGIGRRSLEWLPLPVLTKPEQVALEGAFGFGVISLAALAAGLIGLFNGPVLWAIVVFGGIASFRSVSWARDLSHSIQQAILQTTGNWPRFLMFSVIFVLGCSAVSAFVPPSAWDSMVYHLYGPKIYLQAGRIINDPNNFYLGFSQAAEMLYSITLSAGTDSAAAGVHFVFGIFALMLVGGATWRYTQSSEAAWFAVLLPLTSFSFWELTNTPYVDLAVMAFAMSAFICVEQWSLSKQSRWLVSAGAFGGFAFSTKYNAGAVLLSIGLFVLISELLKRRFPFRDLLALGGSAIAVYVLWAVKGLILWGNPIYPFVFNGLGWTSLRSWLFINPHQFGLLAEGLGWQVPILPFAATIFGSWTGVIIYHNFYLFSTGPWLLTLPILLVFVWGQMNETARQKAKFLLWIGLPILLYWMYSAATSQLGMQPRYIMSAFGLAAILGSLAIYSLNNFPKIPLNVVFIARAALVLTIGFSLSETFSHTVQYEAFAYLTGTDRTTYLDHRMYMYTDAMRELATLPKDSQVRFMWEPRAYYCPSGIKCLPDMAIDHWHYPLEMGLSPDQIFEKWKAEGDDYILIADFQLRSVENAPDYRYLPFHPSLEKWMNKVWVDPVNFYVLYTWKN